MKIRIHSILLLTTLVILAVQGTHAQVGTSYKAQNIDAKGQILDGQGITIGSVSKEGIIKNLKGEKIALVDGQGNLVDAQGKKMGRAAKNGDFFDVNGQLLFSVKDAGADSKCAVLDPKGHQIGTVHQNYKLHACALHCFNLENKKTAAKLDNN